METVTDDESYIRHLPFNVLQLDVLFGVERVFLEVDVLEVENKFSDGLMFSLLGWAQGVP